MIKIYTAPSCSSCRKVKNWFKEQKIPFIEKNIFSLSLKDEDLKEILIKSENGTEDIISKKSKIVKEHQIDIDNMTINELISFIERNPSILKRPIIVDDNRIQVGYNSEDITTFIPFAKRLADWSCQNDQCPKYNSCTHIKDILDN